MDHLNDLINTWKSFDTDNLTFLVHNVYKEEHSFFFIKQSDEYELNPNNFVAFINKEYPREWKSCNAAQKTKPRGKTWTVTHLKLPISGNAKRKKVRIICIYFSFLFFASSCDVQPLAYDTQHIYYFACVEVFIPACR